MKKNKLLSLLWQLISPYMIIFYFLMFAWYISHFLLTKTIVFSYIAILIVPLIVFQIIYPQFQKNKFYELGIIIAFTILLFIKEPQFESFHFKFFLKILYFIMLLNFILSFFISSFARLFSLGAFITFIFYFLQFYSIDPFLFLIVAVLYTAILFLELTKNKIITQKQQLLIFSSGILTAILTFSIFNFLQ